MNLIVVESHFGNTVAVAEAIAAALCAHGEHTEVWMAHRATADIPPEVGLLIVGAPTHDGTLSTVATRGKAAGIGAKDATDSVGIREWIAETSPSDRVRVITFDTGQRTAEPTGSAALAAAHLAREHGFRSVERGPSFAVDGVAGPLLAGELQRARAWARSDLLS